MTAEVPRLVEVAVDAPLSHPLTYLLPPSLSASAQIGMRALVPLGRRQVTGYLVDFPFSSSLPASELREVIALLDPAPLLAADLLHLCRWAAAYYFSPLAEVIKTVLPPGINVASRRQWKLTPAGREICSRDSEEDSIPSGMKTADLEALRAFAQAEENGKKPPLSSVRLKRLAALGLIEGDLCLARPRVQPKTERAVTLRRPLSAEEKKALARRAPVQARFLEELSQGSCRRISELAGQFRNAALLARHLAAAGLVEIKEVPCRRDPFCLVLELPPPPGRLMPEQAEALAAVQRALEVGGFQVFLLQGVTGSGKTEVYLRAIERALALDRQTVMLVPEIALTPQLLSRFRQRFPASLLAVLHSGLSPGERHDEWWRIRRGEAKVVIGARSAVFAPTGQLGLVIVDEEQDTAYKQDHGFRYHARDLAVMRAKMASAVAVLGSATPSLETMFRSRQPGGYHRLLLPRRVDHRPRPHVEIIDLRLHLPRSAETPPEPSPSSSSPSPFHTVTADQLLSPPLTSALEQNLAAYGQSLLFLNRRGLAAFLLCLDCGRLIRCPNCDVSLSLHLRPPAAKTSLDPDYGTPAEEGLLLCHYCGAHQPRPEVCPHCRGVRLRAFGVGTEQLEEAVRKRFPGARVLRMDSDVISGKDSYFRLLERIARREADIIVGTQMVAKGHDLPGITLVGVILAELGLAFPDFRAAERTFQLLVQAAGRAGRGEEPGRVLVQTFQPDHYVLQFALAQDLDGFYEHELRSRERFWYPPFARLATLYLAGSDQESVRQAAGILGRTAKRLAQTSSYQGRIRLLGPAKPPISRLKGKTRLLLLIKAASPGVLSGFLEDLQRRLASEDRSSRVNLTIDRDPGTLM